MLREVPSNTAHHKESTKTATSKSQESLHLRGVLKKISAISNRLLVPRHSKASVCLHTYNHTTDGKVRVDVSKITDNDMKAKKLCSSMLILGGPVQDCKASTQSKLVNTGYFNHYDDGKGDWVRVLKYFTRRLMHLEYT
jgi:hypothetical protein